MPMSTPRLPQIAALMAASLLAQQPGPQTVKGLTTAPGLEVKLWAAGPSLVNPTNIDIDARGRIWVLEGVNYGRELKGEKDYRAAGDRVMILEDTDHDGKVHKAKIFTHDSSLRSPLCIAVPGD